MMRLKGKKTLITGGGSGIGRAAAIIFNRHGSEVSIVGRREENLLITASMTDKSLAPCHAISGDIANRESAELIVKEAADKMGGMDILFNNAGLYSHGSVEDTDEEQWNSLIDINMKGTYLISKHAIEVMKIRGGTIINNASTLGLKPVPNTAAYSAAKAGVVSLTKSMALELAGDRIRVNCICPGVVETPIHEEMHGEGTADFLNEMASFHPLGRVGAPEDIAYAALFLASDEASWITGAVLPVDGGISCA
ncbi:MAG: SDR family oxidoreductase [Deltaproteobacteria bacterium]|nr:SDR family oxidoreductase [Deltaproteobacteria bacterium]